MQYWGKRLIEQLLTCGRCPPPPFPPRSISLSWGTLSSSEGMGQQGGGKLLIPSCHPPCEMKYLLLAKKELCVLTNYYFIIRLSLFIFLITCIHLFSLQIALKIRDSLQFRQLWKLCIMPFYCIVSRFVALREVKSGL